jgi:hypothetical protein
MRHNVRRLTTVARATLAAAIVVTATLAVASCTTWTNGRPVAVPANPTEPSFSTPKPSRTPPVTPSPTPSPPGTPTTSGPRPPGQTLDPNEQGYVFIETKSGKTRCQISRTAVGCEAQFAHPPVKEGVPANGVNITSEGNLRWLVGNLGDIPTVALDYRTYQAVGWTIAAGASGTRFTNDRTGHGMFVSIERVESF